MLIYHVKTILGKKFCVSRWYQAHCAQRRIMTPTWWVYVGSTSTLWDQWPPAFSMNQFIWFNMCRYIIWKIHQLGGRSMTYFFYAWSYVLWNIVSMFWSYVLWTIKSYVTFKLQINYIWGESRERASSVNFLSY